MGGNEGGGLWITLTPWNNKSFVQATPADHTGGSALGHFLLAITGLTSRDTIH